MRKRARADRKKPATPRNRRRAIKPHVSVTQQAETLTSKQSFLAHYVTTGNIAGASRLSGVGRRTVYNWLEEDEEFVTLFDEAALDAGDNLEQEARRRALVGVEEPVWHRGRRVGHVRKYSDTLLIFLLKGAKPDKYRERFEHTGAKGGPIKLEQVIKDARTSLLSKLQQLSDRSSKSKDITVPAATGGKKGRS